MNRFAIESYVDQARFPRQIEVDAAIKNRSAFIAWQDGETRLVFVPSDPLPEEPESDFMWLPIVEVNVDCDAMGEARWTEAPNQPLVSRLAARVAQLLNVAPPEDTIVELTDTPFLDTPFDDDEIDG